MNGRDLPAVRDLAGLFRPPRSDGNNRETGHCVSRQLNVGHDKACTDTTDLELSASDAWVRFKVRRVWHSKRRLITFNVPSFTDPQRFVKRRRSGSSGIKRSVSRLAPA